MAFLTPDKIRHEYGLEIKEKIIPNGNKLKPNRKLSNGTGKVEWITIHNTQDIKEAEGTNDAEQYMRATYNGNMGDVTVHYYIDETDCWQLLNEDEVGYHAADGYNGPGNTTSLAIEIIMDGSGFKADIEAEDRGALLAAILLHRHNLTIDRLTTHNHWYSKKYCPIYILPHWNQFKEQVATYLDAIENSEKEASVILGDVDGDGKVTASDARLILRASVGLEKVDTNIADIDRDGKVTAADSRLALRESVGFKEITFEMGDVNQDGKVTATDARLVARVAVGLETLTEDQIKVADMNQDGKITAVDAKEITNKSVGL